MVLSPPPLIERCSKWFLAVLPIDRTWWIVPSETMLILIVEDELLVGWSLAQALRESGHTILGHTASSHEAIEVSARHAPQLALVDITLDGQVEGISLARRLKRK